MRKKKPPVRKILVVGVSATVSREHAEGFRARFAELGIDAVVVSNCTALAVVEVEQVMP